MDQTDAVITNINQITSLDDKNNLSQRNNKEPNVLANQSTNSTDLNNSQSIKPSKRPKNTALKQQRLPAWQPILTAKTVLPLFFSIGVIFVILGAILLHYSNTVNEKEIDYTNCLSIHNNGIECSKLANYNTTCYCRIKFTLDKDYEAPVYLYYGLKNFYQNHRRYVKSRDDNQLLGNSLKNGVNKECEPYDKNKNTSRYYAPCGAIANSLFNDSFSVSYIGEQSISPPLELSLIATGIAWDTDKNVKFKNPSSWDGTERPVNWKRDAWNLSSDPNNNGYKNEDLIVWMRTAALPSFRKFYRRVNHSLPQFSKSLPKGTYNVTIEYNYPVTSFDGRKLFVISTTSWIGGKNPFLGIAYLVVGCLCIVLGFVFLIIHFKFSKNTKASDEILNNTNLNINNNNNNNNNTRTTLSIIQTPERS